MARSDDARGNMGPYRDGRRTTGAPRRAAGSVSAGAGRAPGGDARQGKQPRTYLDEESRRETVRFEEAGQAVPRTRSRAADADRDASGPARQTAGRAANGAARQAAGSRAGQVARASGGGRAGQASRSAGTERADRAAAPRAAAARESAATSRAGRSSAAPRSATARTGAAAPRGARAGNYGTGAYRGAGAYGSDSPRGTFSPANDTFSPSVKKRPGGKGRIIAIVAAVVVVIAVIVIVATMVLGGASQPAGDAQTAVQDTSAVAKATDTAATGKRYVDESGIYHGGKLDGATETVDAQGVVHGVKDGVSYTVTGRGSTALQTGKVTFIGTGDQVVGDWALEIADANAGVMYDDEYDFYTWYQDTADFIGGYDLKYIDQETPLAGGTYSGWPVFNTPDAAAEALEQVGFNLINFANNHTYDMGTDGVERTQQVFAQWADHMLFGGSYASEEDRSTIHMIERNGVTFAFLAYTYGDNMYGTDAYNELRPNMYYNNVMDADIITQDVQNAQKVADIVIVSMHWGDEYTTEPSDFQYDYAQLLVDLDVDLVVGEHAHILQPVHMYTSASGKEIPVVFGLSDYVSGWTLVETNISGLYCCDFVYDETGVRVENSEMYICEEYQSGDSPVTVRRLCDMTDDELAANTRNDNVDDLVAYVEDYFANVRFDIPIIR